MSQDETILKPTRLLTHPHTTRSRLMLEVASQLVSRKDFPYLQARIDLREQGADEWPLTLFASDSPATIEEVAAGKVQFAIINPSMMLRLATLGSAPFKEAIPLRVIAVLPSLDSMLFAVKQDTGLKSFQDIRERKFPLRVSLRAQPDHSLHVIVDHVFKAAGFSLDDIVSWGGEVRYDAGMAYGPNRIGAMQRGEINAIFDEGAGAWGNMALELGMNFLSLDENILARLEAVGLRRGLIEKKYFAKLSADVPTLDFSGWPIYTHENTSDAFVTDFCRALEQSKERIPWAQAAPLPLAQMVRDTPEGHLEVPLHPAAERFWREQGYLP
ncbi:MAG TPA: TAXI family TRAP transporter solute-binding subunit [Candidatus Binatia bacterium]|nr:TAXI family TRAP transporter solute-binding subunit [Candidatus Binatia bacterium]